MKHKHGKAIPPARNKRKARKHPKQHRREVPKNKQSRKLPRFTTVKRKRPIQGSRKQQRARQKFGKSNLPIDPRVARGLGVMRREGVSASEAARLQRMKLSTFRKGAGRFLYRSGPGKPWKARTEDQLAFSMEMLTRQGRISVIIHNSRERRLLHDYENALRMFRGAEDGAEAELKKFDGKTVGGYELITDTKLLIELEEADQLDFESLYPSFGGRS